MRTIIFLAVFIAAAFFTWRWLLKRDDRSLAGKWGLRMAIALLVGGLSSLALFSLMSTTTWKIW